MKTKLMFLLIGVAALSLSATVANNGLQSSPVTEQYAVGTSRFGNTPLFWDAFIIPTGRHPAVLVIHEGGFKHGIVITRGEIEAGIKANCDVLATRGVV